MQSLENPVPERDARSEHHLQRRTHLRRRPDEYSPAPSRVKLDDRARPAGANGWPACSQNDQTISVRQVSPNTTCRPAFSPTSSARPDDRAAGDPDLRQWPERTVHRRPDHPNQIRFSDQPDRHAGKRSPARLHTTAAQNGGSQSQVSILSRTTSPTSSPPLETIDRNFIADANVASGSSISQQAQLAIAGLAQVFLALQNSSLFDSC